MIISKPSHHPDGCYTKSKAWFWREIAISLAFDREDMFFVAHVSFTANTLAKHVLEGYVAFGCVYVDVYVRWYVNPPAIKNCLLELLNI